MAVEIKIWSWLKVEKEIELNKSDYRSVEHLKAFQKEIKKCHKSHPIMAHHPSLCLCLVILLVLMIVSTNGLQCHICGQFNDGVGSITPCLNYTETNAHLHLKECPRKSDKFCVVSMWNFRNYQNILFGPAKAQFSIFNYNFLLRVSSEKLLFAVCLRRTKWEKMFMEMRTKKLFSFFGGIFKWTRRYVTRLVMWWNAWWDKSFIRLASASWEILREKIGVVVKLWRF